MSLPDSEMVPLRPGLLGPPELCPVRWRRSERARSVSLRIDPRAGDVVVTLPMRSSRRAGLEFLATHAAWVLKRIKALAPSISLAHGAAVPLGGMPHPVLHDPSRHGGAFVENGAIIVTGAAEFLPRRLRDFLRGEAKRRIIPLAAIHADKLGVAIKAIRVKDTQSRWGSCAPDGTLAFSWRLVMAPDAVLDYVVAHEVAHLRELNHSPRFWVHVAALAPHREEAETWLREEGPALLRVG